MNCISCREYIDGHCKIEPIFASGYLRNCPGLPGPVISPLGGNLSVMKEVISRPDGYERIEVTPRKYPGKNGWYCTIMICYSGKGVVIASYMYTLPLEACRIAWGAALNKIKEINHQGLNALIPAILRRISFDYSDLIYREVRVETAPVKERFVVMPKDTDNLMDVMIPDFSNISSGDQLDLFAL